MVVSIQMISEEVEGMTLQHAEDDTIDVLTLFEPCERFEAETVDSMRNDHLAVNGRRIHLTCIFEHLL